MNIETCDIGFISSLFKQYNVFFGDSCVVEGREHCKKCKPTYIFFLGGGGDQCVIRWYSHLHVGQLISHYKSYKSTPIKNPTYCLYLHLFNYPYKVSKGALSLLSIGNLHRIKKRPILPYMEVTRTFWKSDVSLSSPRCQCSQVSVDHEIIHAKST